MSTMIDSVNVLPEFNVYKIDYINVPICGKNAPYHLQINYENYYISPDNKSQLKIIIDNIIIKCDNKNNLLNYENNKIHKYLLKKFNGQSHIYHITASIFCQHMINIRQLITICHINIDIVLEMILLVYYLYNKSGWDLFDEIFNIHIFQSINFDKLEYNIPCFNSDGLIENNLYKKPFTEIIHNLINKHDKIEKLEIEINSYKQENKKLESKIEKLEIQINSYKQENDKIKKLETEIGIYKELVNKLIIKISNMEKIN